MQMRPLSPWRLAALASIGLAASFGCAPSPPAAQTPASAVPDAEQGFASPPPNEADTAEQELVRSEQALDRELAHRRSLAEGAPVAVEQAPRSAAEAAEPPQPSPQSPPRPQQPRFQPQPGGPEGPCDAVCRAFRSMRQSANRLCLLVGQRHARCERARSRVEAANQRLHGAGCDCGCGCGGGE